MPTSTLTTRRLQVTRGGRIVALGGGTGLRNCLLALSECDPRMASLFDFQFPGNSELGDHNLGKRKTA